MNPNYLFHGAHIRLYYALIYIFFLFSATRLQAELALVFIHIGKEIPKHADTALAQARLFNPQARIILLGSARAMNRLEEKAKRENIELCDYESLPMTSIHKKYQIRCAETSPFWRYTSERFLYLWDLMKAYKLNNVFHLENDVMLYADLNSYLPFFQTLYPGIAATFDNDERCIPGFLWISGAKAMKPLASYFCSRAPERLNDMQLIGAYRKNYKKQYIDTLPIIMQSYATKYALKSPHHHSTKRPEAYWNHTDTFQAIFDAAAIGQYLGGIDPIHKNNGPGFINESCLFNPSYLQYRWLLDECARLVPYAVFKKKAYKIMNLHIHSKRLYAFKSR